MARTVSGTSAAGVASGSVKRDASETTAKDKDIPRDRMDTLAKERREAARGERSEDWRRGVLAGVFN